MRYRMDSTAIVHCALMNKEWINAYRMTVTNLGNVAAMLPAGENHIKNIDVLLSPRRNAPYNCGIVSYNEELHIILTHGRGESPLVKAIGARLEDMGIVFHCTPYV